MYVYDIMFWEEYESNIHGISIKLRKSGADLEKEYDADGF